MFWSLVKHEACWRIRNGKNHWNWLIFAVFIALVGIVGTTFLANTKDIHPQKIFYFLTSYPFFLFMLAIAQFSREWKHQTIGWWLSLPYSRLTLIMAKFVALLWKGFVILMTFLVIAIFLFYYLLMIDAPIEQALFFLTGLKWFLVLLLSNPLIISIGLLFSVLCHSVYRAPTIIIWSLFWVFFGNLWAYSSRFSISSWSHLPFLIGIAAVSWVISYGLLRWSATLLKRNLKL